jgi:hypothetical protein
MDCSSLTEQMLCERAGIGGSEIMFFLERQRPPRILYWHQSWVDDQSV